MSDFSVDEFRRPTTLAMAALAIVGWLLVAYFWSQTGELRTAMDDSLHRAEVARQGLAADLQNLQKAAGTEAELKKKADDAAKSLADAVAARASAQNDMADLNKQVTEAKLALSGAQEEATKRAQDLQALEANIKTQTDALAQLQAQTAALTAQQTQAQAALADAQSQARAAADATSAARAELSELEKQIEAAKALAAEPPKN